MKFFQTTDTSDFKLECVKMFLEKFFWQGRNFKKIFLAVLEFSFVGREHMCILPLQMKGLGKLGIALAWNYSKGNLFLGVTILYLVYFDTFLQSARDTFKTCNSYFINKYDKSLLQNASGFYVTKYDSFITKSDGYYKMPHLLQNASVSWTIGKKSILFRFNFWLNFRWKFFKVDTL